MNRAGFLPGALFLVALATTSSTSQQEPSARAGQHPGSTDSGRNTADVVSETKGFNFGPYLSKVVEKARKNWYKRIPSSAWAPEKKKGKVTIEFTVLRNGKVAGLKIAQSSEDSVLDQAALESVPKSKFPRLPKEFSGEELRLRFYFYYNPEKSP